MKEVSFTAGKSEAENRADSYIINFLKAEKPELALTRSSLEKMFKDGNCLINGEEAEKNYKIKPGDNIYLMFPEPLPVEIKAENIELDVIYEDNSVIVINKPRGIVVHPSAGHTEGTLVNALLYHCGESLSGINGEIRPGIVHRLDKDTSGLLIAAKNDIAHNNLAAQIKNRTALREYQAVVGGKITGNGIIDAPIARSRTDRKKMAVGSSGNAREAVTEYEVIENYGNFTHVKCRLITGRTHQIRVHMAYTGHPVAGDTVYGNGKPKWLGGQCLFAWKLGFIHPVSNIYMEFMAEMPDYFQKMIKEINGKGN